MPITKRDVIVVWEEMKHFCGAKWTKPQSKKVCARAARTMTKELMEKGTVLNAGNIAAAANVVDGACQKYSKDNKRICGRAIGSFIRRLSRLKPGLQGRR